jgi:integrase
MKKDLDFFQLFACFIQESKAGKRLKKDGSRLKSGTIKHYEAVYNELQRFQNETNHIIKIRSHSRFNARELNSDALYWKRFYKKYSDYLYNKGAFDNYVGAQFKVLRTFFIYLKNDKHLFLGNGYKAFYIRTENIPITVLTLDQLHFLINDKEFESSLPNYLKRTKDIFVFGCTVGLRFSDLMELTPRNLEKTSGNTYLKTRSIKTAVDTRIMLPEYALEIINRYKSKGQLLPKISNNRLNLNIKELCFTAGWVEEIGKKREKKGLSKAVQITNPKSKKASTHRFCDLVSTHTMRRTAITTMLSLGMPEIMVRNISGHAANSKEFYKYVHYAQQLVDSELGKIHHHLNPKN